MTKIFHLLLFILPVSTFSQATDPTGDSKWVNYKRVRMAFENSSRYFEEKRFVTENGDTLIRDLIRSKETKNVIREASYMHGKKNGLEILYFPNGVIEEINYYLDGKLWESISRADSNGRLLNPGTLHNGKGTKFFTGYLNLDTNCYETFNNGLPDGPFYQRTGEHTAVTGDLTYKKDVVNYSPAKRIMFRDSSGKKYSEVFEVGLFKQIYTNIRESNPDTILAVLDDSVAEDAREFWELSLSFNDPAIIPKGRWKVFDVNTGKIVRLVDYDNSGNAIKIVTYKEDGSIFWQKGRLRHAHYPNRHTCWRFPHAGKVLLGL